MHLIVSFPANDFWVLLHHWYHHIAVHQIVESIDKGKELQEYNFNNNENLITDEFKLKYNDCIVLNPQYQREYRSTHEDESSLIESILVGIPIPPVFLVSAKIKGVQVLDVVDGQHRLNAIDIEKINLL